MVVKAKFLGQAVTGGASAFTDLTDVPQAYTGQGGKVVAVKADVSGLEFIAQTSTDEKVKYDAGDPTSGYVADKIVAGTGISVAEGSGANENKLVITNSNPTAYTLPVATASVLGGVKKGDRVSIDANGVVSADVQTVEGTAVKSTGEAGGTKFLREDGDGTSSRQAIPAAGGDVIGPAANTADYIPQWSGTDSKTLKNGLAVPAGGLAGLTALGGKVDSNTAITGATKTKITYDAKGLVTGGTDASVGDISGAAPINNPTFTGTVTLPTGTNTVGPIKFVSGINLTTPIAGVMEFDGTNLFISI